MWNLLIDISYMNLLSDISVMYIFCWNCELSIEFFPGRNSCQFFFLGAMLPDVWITAGIQWYSLIPGTVSRHMVFAKSMPSPWKSPYSDGLRTPLLLSHTTFTTHLPTWIYLNLNMDKWWFPLVWDEIIYAFLNCKGCMIEVWQFISNFIPQFTGHVITYPCCD